MGRRAVVSNEIRQRRMPRPNGENGGAKGENYMVRPVSLLTKKLKIARTRLRKS
jgi:hypothetical protein